MKEYDVKITETLEKTVTVEATSRADAEEQVRSAYYNSEYILDSENFTGVEFGTTEEREIQQEQAETMTVLLVKPHMYPQQVQIGCDLEDLQKAVGGDIEAVYPFNEPVALVMHDEGKIMGKDLNRALRDEDGEIYDIIAGVFLVVGLGEEDFSSLSPELMKQFEEHFHQPETFVRMGRSIMALPLPDDMVKKEDAPGVHRQTIYYIVANGDFELIKVGRYKRATKESFEKWYHNQTRYQLAEDRQERS